jgi:hypothetical protein
VQRTRGNPAVGAATCAAREVDTRSQVARREARKGDRDDAFSGDAVLEQPADALLDRRRLAGARTGDDTNVVALVVCGGALRGDSLLNLFPAQGALNSTVAAPAVEQPLPGRSSAAPAAVPSEFRFRLARAARRRPAPPLRSMPGSTGACRVTGLLALWHFHVSCRPGPPARPRSRALTELSASLIVP